MKFADKIKRNLIKYKVQEFPELEDGLWSKNKEPYPHILPKANEEYNLLSTYRLLCNKYITDEKIKRHSDFHHLNSSQAMCFNFFFPLIHERKLELITDFLGLSNDTVVYDTVCFEKDGLERKFGRRPTSFDFYFETTSKKKIYFEIKYTEYEFGKASKDANHLDKFETVYSKHLQAINSKFHSSLNFLEHYQILRNLVHIEDDNSLVVFIYPQENLKIKNAAEQVKMNMLIPKYKDNFFGISWESMFMTISNSSLNNNLKTQYCDFNTKYLSLDSY